MFPSSRPWFQHRHDRLDHRAHNNLVVPGRSGRLFSLDLDPTKAAVGGFDGRIDIDVSLVRWWKSCVRTFLLTGTVEPVLQ